MQLSDEQLDSFIELYKEELDLEISRAEALESALALLRLMNVDRLEERC